MRETDKRCIQWKAMVRIAAAMMAVALMFGLMTFISRAEEVQVTVTSVKIRASADVNSDMIGGAMAGDTLSVISEVTGADNYTWYQVSFEDGAKTGYVRSDCVSKVGETGATITPAAANSAVSASNPSTDVVALQPISATVTGEQVRVRSNASTSGSIVSTVQKDVVLTVTGSAQDSESKTWYQVTYSDANGQVTGFIRYDYISLEGEAVPADQATEDPVDPVESAEGAEPDPTPTPVQKDYDTQLNEDGWYLLDHSANRMYLITDLFETSANNKKLYDDSVAQIKTMKIVMIILVIAVILLALTATLLFFKIRDMMDAAYFEEVEKETIRKRQGGTGKASMPTVGAGNRSGTSRPAGQRPAGSGQQGTAAQKTAVQGTAAQRTASQKLADQRSADQRSAGSSQSQSKPSGQRPTGQERSASQQKPTGQQRTAGQSQSVSRDGASERQNPSRQSQNFLAEDDEFDFEYLNWDGEEDN